MLAHKLIFMDLDGTLLNSEKKISPKTHYALIAAQQEGAKLVLASGRPLPGILPLAKALQMDIYEGFLISFNGAQVMDCKTGQVLYNKTMTVEEGQAILQHVENFDVIPMVVKDDYTYVKNVFAGHLDLAGTDFNVIDYEAHSNGYKLCEVDNMAVFADFPLNKILLAGQPEYLDQHYQEISAPFGDEVNAMFTAPFYYEFTAKGIDKAKAIDTIFKPMGYQPEDMIAFGDGQNDATMVAYVGLGFAMENAVDMLKEIADKETKSNDQDGIAYALENLV